MARLLFEKTGRAVWISHLDLMRLFQRAFKRAGLPLTHTQGYNPRPSVSIALPMSVGVESQCELLDFDLEGEAIAPEEIQEKLNRTLVEGIRVKEVYSEGAKIKNLAFLRCVISMKYDLGVPEKAEEQLETLFSRESLKVEKKGKNGMTQQDIIPMLKSYSFTQIDEQTLTMTALICCQNPSLNPMQISAAIAAYLPAYAPDFCKYRRQEIYDVEEKVFR